MKTTEVICRSCGDLHEVEVCKCGIDYLTWMDCDMLECVGDGLHIWEDE